MTGKLIRMTRQRQMILKELRETAMHPSADQLYELLRKKLPHLSLGTVYRNLEAMADAGLILRLESGRGPRRYDGGTHEHHHIRCLGCGKMEDLEISFPTGLDRAVKLGSGYQVTGHILEFMGYCPKCAKKNQSKK